MRLNLFEGIAKLLYAALMLAEQFFQKQEIQGSCLNNFFAKGHCSLYISGKIPCSCIFFWNVFFPAQLHLEHFFSISTDSITTL